MDWSSDDGLAAGVLERHETALWSADGAEVVEGGALFGRAASIVVTDRRVIATSSVHTRSWSFTDLPDISYPTTTSIRISELDAPPTIIRVPTAAVREFRAAIERLHEYSAQADAALGVSNVVIPEVGDPVTTAPLPALEPPPRPRSLASIRGPGDRVFHGVSWAGGLSVLVIMTLVGLFLSVRGVSALKATGLSFLTTAEWQPDTHHFGIAAVMTGTVLIAAVALVAAVPLAIGTALFISEVAPRRMKQWFISAVDLMAAVPSIVYGLWGAKFLMGHVLGLSRWISTWFGWIPLFKVEGADPRNPLNSSSVYAVSTFIAGLVVALMVVPISCSIMREVFSQAPPGEREGAYALGSTRWGMIRSVVLPFGRGGMIGAVMLGLGRALGETIAVYLIISPVFTINFHILEHGSNSVAALIALRQGDASGFGLSALMAAGLALFAVTLVVNFSAAAVVARSRSGAQTD